MTDHQDEHWEYPRFLKVLCWLSGFFGIYQVLLNFLGASNPPTESVFDESASEISGGEEFIEAAKAYEAVFNQNHVTHHLSLMILFIMGLIGVYQMYRLKKRGFFMYGLSHILISVYPIFMVYQNAYSEVQAIMDGVFTALFIAFYANQLKHMS